MPKKRTKKVVVKEPEILQDLSPVVEPSEPVTKAPAPPVEEHQASVTQDTINDIIARQDMLEDQNKALQKDLESKEGQLKMLSYAADKGRIAAWQTQNEDKLVKTVSLSVMEDKLVIAWEMIKNDVGYRDGKVYENQTIKLILRDKNGELSDKVYPYVHWCQQTSKARGEVIKEVNDKERGELFVVVFEDFGEVEVPMTFVNPF